MEEYLFSYGTLQEERTQLTLLGRVVMKFPDQLFGYKVRDIQITDPKFLARGESPDQRTLVLSDDQREPIHGSVLAITPEELLRIDSYEPDNYIRQMVTLASGKEAWVYVANKVPDSKFLVQS